MKTAIVHGHPVWGSIFSAVPQTFVEAVNLWGPDVIGCEPHEWDNCTTEENALWLLCRLHVRRLLENMRGKWKCPAEDCEHENFEANVAVARMPTKEGGPIKRFMADVTVKCEECGTPFRFIGLPAGCDLNGASVSVDACEARLAIAPKGEVLSELEGGDVGFSIRKVI